MNTEKKVYIARSHCDLLKDILRDNSIEVLEQKGPYNEDYLKVCHALVPGKIPVTAELIDKMSNLKIISKFGVGVDRIDIPECTKMSIYVCNTPQSNLISVAEHTIALMLMATRKIYPFTLRLRSETLDWAGAIKIKGIELYGKTLSIIGLGNIGRRVARLAYGFEMNIIGYDPYADRAALPEYVSLCDTMEEALTAGDFVSLHVAGTDKTRNMIDAEQLAQMKKTAIIINTTRGFVVNEAALIAALNDGVIAGAALDVFNDEPISADNPLLKMENVAMTPHRAAYTEEAWLRSQVQTAENIIGLFNGNIPKTAINGPF